MNDKAILDLVNQAQSAIDKALSEITPELHHQYEVGKLGRVSGLLHEFTRPIYKRNSKLRPPPWAGEIEPEFTDAERAEINQLSSEHIAIIDAALLALATDRFQKVARIVADFMKNSPLYDPKLPDIFYSERIEHLAKRGLLTYQGNLRFMRFSEVKQNQQ